MISIDDESSLGDEGRSLGGRDGHHSCPSNSIDFEQLWARRELNLRSCRVGLDRADYRESTEAGFLFPTGISSIRRGPGGEVSGAVLAIHVPEGFEC